jgi:hypothetical protein
MGHLTPEGRKLSSFITSWIPTTSVAVTRAADVAVMPTNASWFNKDNFTLLSEVSGMPTGWTGGAFTGPSTASGDQSFYQAIGSSLDTSFVLSGYGGVGGGPTITRNVSKIATAFTTNRMSLAANGVFGGANGGVTPAILPMARLSIGCSPWGLDAQFNSYFRRLNVWNRALSDAEMQQVTT